jgi:hypothetical protein
MNDALERPFPTQDIFTQVALIMPPVFYMSLIGAVLLDTLLFKRWKNRGESHHPDSH